MTEAEWLVGTDATQMLAFLKEHHKPSERKLRLFVSAFWRWQAGKASRAELRAVERADLRKRAAAMECWAETGKLPPGFRKSQSKSVIFFGPATPAATMTACAPTYWFNENGRRAKEVQPPLLRCLFGNPFRPPPASSFPPHILGLVESIYAAFPDVSPDYAILADALEEAGHDPEMVAHAREPGEHVRGCWLLDLILSKDR